jgi:hypothetical protein
VFLRLEGRDAQADCLPRQGSNGGGSSSGGQSRVSDGAYVFSAAAALASGAVTLGLRPERAPGVGRGVEAETEAAVAGGDLNRLAADLAE